MIVAAQEAAFDWSWQTQVNFFEGYAGVTLYSNGILSTRADPPIDPQDSSSPWLRFYIRVPSATGYENAAAALLKLSLQVGRTYNAAVMFVGGGV